MTEGNGGVALWRCAAVLVSCGIPSRIFRENADGAPQRANASLQSNNISRLEFAMFKVNEGSGDRIFRALLGLGVLSLVFIGPKTPWGWLGVIPLVTAAIGWCPLYEVMGISTCKTAPPAK